MHIWDYIIRAWPIASVMTPVLIGIAFLWLKSKFALRSEIARIDADMAALGKRLDHKNAIQDSAVVAHDTRIALLEKDSETPPSRHEMTRDLGNVLSRVTAVESEVKGISRQLGTSNDYLQLLVEREVKR